MAGELSTRDVQALVDFADADLVGTTDVDVTTGTYAGAGGKSVKNTWGDRKTWIRAGVVSSDDVGTIEVLTQAAYDALTPVATTLYVISG